MFPDILTSAIPMFVVFLEDTLVNNPLGFYDRFQNFDIFMHLLGGFVTAWSSYRLYGRLEKRYRVSIKPLWLLCLWCIGMTAFVGILWEVYELVIDPFVSVVMQPSVVDTVADLLNDIIGALGFCGVVSLWLKMVKNSRKNS